jgi:hypothetical protein
MYVPVLQRIFSTAPLSAKEWLVMAMFAPVLLVADEARKFVIRRLAARSGQTTGTMSSVLGAPGAKAR